MFVRVKIRSEFVALELGRAPDQVVKADASLAHHRHVALVKAHGQGFTSGMAVQSLVPIGVEFGGDRGARPVRLHMIGFVLLHQPAVGADVCFAASRSDPFYGQTRQVRCPCLRLERRSHDQAQGENETPFEPCFVVVSKIEFHDLLLLFRC